jgi:hypothetical protein
MKSINKLIYCWLLYRLAPKNIPDSKYFCFHFRSPKYLYQINIITHLPSFSFFWVQNSCQILLYQKQQSSVKMSKGWCTIWCNNALLSRAQYWSYWTRTQFQSLYQTWVINHLLIKLLIREEITWVYLNFRRIDVAIRPIKVWPLCSCPTDFSTVLNKQKRSIFRRFMEGSYMSTIQYRNYWTYK